MAGHCNTFWVGIDVSKAKFDAALCPCETPPQGWRGLEARTFESTKAGAEGFARWLRAAGGACEGLCAESTGIYSADLAEAVAAADASLPRLSIVNPAHVKGAARALGARDKTDAVDARIIAAYAAWQKPAPRPPRTGVWAELRALADAREALLGQRLAFENRSANTRSAEGRRVFDRVVKNLKREIEKLDRLIAALVAGDPVMREHARLLQTVPAIGPVIAVALLARFGDLREWSRAQITAAAGLHPRARESGSSVRGKPRLAKGGGGFVRKKLYMGAIHLLRKDHGFNRSALRLRAENKPPMVCLGAAMRKLLIVARAVVVSGKPYDPQFAA